MIKGLHLFLLLVYGVMVLGQEQIQYLNGVVENESTGFPMESVHILNLNIVEWTTTDKKGNFEIMAQVNDTLYFSYLGFKSLKVAVTQDMLKAAAVAEASSDSGTADVTPPSDDDDDEFFKSLADED